MSDPGPDPDVSVQPPGLWVRRGPVPTMAGFHRHDDLEINVVLAGELDYLFGGERVRVPAGHTALFWAAAPHRLLVNAEQASSDVCWIHVPLPVALRWSLPDTFAREVLAQRTVVVPTPAVGGHLERQFDTWQRDLAGGAPTAALLLEANALVLRILASRQRLAVDGRTDAGRADAGVPDLRPVAAMARFTAERFRQPIGTADIARAAGLNANYATTLFRRSVGLTLGEHVLRHRIAEAQRLLVTTTMTTAAVAHAAGFGSSSSLYAQFTRACGCPPGEYRASRRLPPSDALSDDGPAR